MWRPVLAVTVLIMLFTGSMIRDLNTEAESQMELNARRALDAFQAMQIHLAVPGERFYAETYPSSPDHQFSYVWPFSQALAATIDLQLISSPEASLLPEIQSHVQALEHYWNTDLAPPAYASAVLPPLGPGGDVFLDDNEWIGLELLRVYRLTGETALLRRAIEIFQLVTTNWDDDPALPAPGGVYWTLSPAIRDRNTVSTAPGAKLGLRLHEITGEPYYLDWATMMYQWTDQHIRAPSGLYWDHVAPDGTIEQTMWSYNQGSMIGAAVLLYRATGEQQHLEHAIQIADAALAYYGQGDRLREQSPAFNAIFFKNLLLLAGETGDLGYREAMQQYAERIWQDQRDVETGLFVPGPDQPVELLQHAGMIQIYAVLAWNPDDYRLL